MRVITVILAICLASLMVTEGVSAFLDPGMELAVDSTESLAGILAGTGALSVTGNFVPVGTSLESVGDVVGPDLGLSTGGLPQGQIPPTVYLKQSADASITFSNGADSGVALISKSRRQLVLNRDAVTFAKANGDVDSGKTLLVAAEYSGFETQGVRFFTRRAFRVAGLAGRLFLLGDVLSGSDYSSTVASGPVTDDQYILSITRLESRPGTSDQGVGVALHGGISLVLPEGWEVTATVENAFSRMWWGSLVQSQATANSATTVTDPDGYVRFAPVISGSERTVGVWQEFPVEPALIVGRRINNIEYRLKMDLYEDRIVFQPEVRWKPKNLSLTLSLRDLDRSVNLGIQYGPASLMLTTNDIKLDRATSVGLQAKYSVLL